MKQEQSWTERFENEFKYCNFFRYEQGDELSCTKDVIDFIKDLEQKVRTETIEEIRLNEFPRIYNNGFKDGLALNKSKGDK